MNRGFGSLPIQRSAEYREATACYERREYSGALARIQALLAEPGHSEGEREFLRRQQAICLAARDGKPTLTPRPPLPSDGRGGDTLTRQPGSRPAETDCGPVALWQVCRKLGVSASVGELRKHAGTGERGTTMAGLARAAAKAGLKAEGVQMDRKALSRLRKAAVAWVDGSHFLAVLSVRGKRARVFDPRTNREEVMATDELYRRCSGILLVVSE